MQPNYPPQYPAQPMPPQYPQQPAAYPQAPQYPVAPPAPAYQPQYPQQPQGYPQGYAQPQYAPAAPPAPPLPTGTLDSFYQQPSGGGGPSFKFRDANAQPQIGKSYVGIVARPVTDADIRAQTDQAGRAMTFKDGRTKFVMVVPMQVQPSQEFPDGQAGWWVKGQARDELARAMAEAGAPAGAPEAGAGIRVTLVSVRPVPNMSPAYQYRIDYVRPQGAAPAPQPGGPVEQYNNPAAPQQFPQPGSDQGGAYGPYATPYAAANPGHGPFGDGAGPQQFHPGGAVPVVSTATGQPVVHQQQVPPAVIQQQPAPQPVTQPGPQQVAPAPSAAPQGFSPEQAALFAKLTGGQAAA